MTTGLTLGKGTCLGPYEIIALLGTGGMGEVYRARDTRLGRDVAIKVLPRELAGDRSRLRRFEHEARAASALNHPGVLTVHDLGVHDGAPYLVTELLEGSTLASCLEDGPFPLRRALELAGQMAHGLAAAHAQGIVHRDLKPSNVFVTNEGATKILDFGLAKHESGAGEPDSSGVSTHPSTRPGVVMGTVGYMAPEQVRGAAVDHRADIFSFGCVLYEMLSGVRAFQRDSAAETQAAILHGAPAPLPRSIPPMVQRVVSRCLEKEPHDRFAHARDVAAVLRDSRALLTRDTDAEQARPQSKTWFRRASTLGWASAATVLAIAAMIAGLRVSLRGRPESLPVFHPRQVTGRHGIAGEAVISPNGAEIAFTGEESGNSDIWITDAQGGGPLRLTHREARDAGASWFPDGSALAFTSDHGGVTSVWKVPRLGGEAMELVRNARDPAVSPDGTRIAFARPGEDGFLRIWLASLDDVDKARRLTGPGDGLWQHRKPAWSPDGRTICYQDQRDLWLVSPSGGRARPFTQDDPGDFEPVWSPSGQHIYFTSRREGTCAIWRKPLAGGEPVRVTNGTGPEQMPSLSRDGRRLAFSSGPLEDTTVVVNLQTGAWSRVQEHGRVLQPAIAPDNSALVFQSNIGGSVDLWSLALGGEKPYGEPTRLTSHPGAVNLPAFSPDGRWIAYFRVYKAQRDVWVIPASGGQALNFTDHQGVNVQPAWAPDGAQIAFVSDRSGSYQVWVAPFKDGRRVGEARQVTHSDHTLSSPTWSPDGGRIAYVERSAAGSEVWAVPVSGSEAPKRLTAGAQVQYVRWSWASGMLVASGSWGLSQPSMRLVPPGGGATRALLVNEPVRLSASSLEFDLSRDAKLLAFVQSETRRDLWLLETDGGTF